MLFNTPKILSPKTSFNLYWLKKNLWPDSNLEKIFPVREKSIRHVELQFNFSVKDNNDNDNN